MVSSVRKIKMRVTAVAALVVILGIAMIVGLRVRGQSSPPCTSAFAAMLQSGIGAQGPCPVSLSTISASISNLSSFTQYRSGLAISSATQQRLAQLEQESWPGQSVGEVRLTRLQMKNMITAEFQSIASSLSDSQISSMANSSFSMVPAWRPPSRNNGVDFTGSYVSVRSRTTFAQDIQQLRSGDPTMQSLAATQLSNAIDHWCNVMAYVLPDWNVTYYSPYRVFVIAYNLATDDQLIGSYTDCENRMSNLGTWLTQQGFPAPPQGAVLWGDSGWLYARPTSIIFSNAVQSDLLNRFAAVPFGKCLRNDSDASFVMFNSSTGQYLFQQACGSGTTVSGTGTISIVNSVLYITDTTPGRNVRISYSTNQLTGHATITLNPSPGVYQTFTISDTNPNPSCQCQ